MINFLLSNLWFNSVVCVLSIYGQFVKESTLHPSFFTDQQTNLLNNSNSLEATAEQTKQAYSSIVPGKNVLNHLFSHHSHVQLMNILQTLLQQLINIIREKSLSEASGRKILINKCTIYMQPWVNHLQVYREHLCNLWPLSEPIHWLLSLSQSQRNQWTLLRPPSWSCRSSSLMYQWLSS